MQQEPPYAINTPPLPLEYMEEEHPHKGRSRFAVVCGTVTFTIFLVSIFLLTASAIGAIRANHASKHTETLTPKAHGTSGVPTSIVTATPTQATPTTAVVPIKPPVRVTLTPTQQVVAPTATPTALPGPTPTMQPTPTATPVPPTPLPPTPTPIPPTPTPIPPTPVPTATP